MLASATVAIASRILNAPAYSTAVDRYRVACLFAPPQSSTILVLGV